MSNLKQNKAMTLYRKLFDPRFISAEDLDGREVTLTIDKVDICNDIHNTETNKIEEKPILVFVEKHRDGKYKGEPIKMVLNKTNAKKIAELYGRHYEGWSGKRILLYPTSIKAFKQVLDAIRIKKPLATNNPAQAFKEPAPELVMSGTDELEGTKS